MKPKFIAIGFIVLLCAGLGAWIFFRMRGAAPAADDEDQNVPTVVSVQTGTLDRMTLHRYVTGYGSVETAPAMAGAPAAGSALSASSAGVVAQVDVVEGQHVEKGDVLVELNSSTTMANYARQEVERQKKLYAQHNTSLKSLQDAEAQLALLEVVTPLSGTVTRVNVRPGAAVDPTTVVADVMDLNRLAVSAAIPAADAGELKTGDEVEVGGTGLQAVNGQDARSTNATLSFVSPAVDAASGTVLAQALLPPDSGLRPGQFVELKIVTATHTNCLAAPNEAVVTDESGKSVISLVNKDEADQVPVQTGFRENGWVEIEGNGLKEGDTVVTVGAYGLPDKTKIQVANQSGQQ